MLRSTVNDAGIRCYLPTEEKALRPQSYPYQGRNAQSSLLWHVTISGIQNLPASSSQGWIQGNWLSSKSDRDSCPGHTFIIKLLLTVKTAEHFWGDWAKLPQETCWFQPPGQSRCPDLLFILLNTFIDLLPSPNMCKGRFDSFAHRASPGLRNWGWGKVRHEIFRVHLLSTRNRARRVRHVNNDKTWPLSTQSTQVWENCKEERVLDINDKSYRSF